MESIERVRFWLRKMSSAAATGDKNMLGVRLSLVPVIKELGRIPIDIEDLAGLLGNMSVRDEEYATKVWREEEKKLYQLLRCEANKRKLEWVVKLLKKGASERNYIGYTIEADMGSYVLVASANDETTEECDDTIALYVGRDTDGQHELIARNNDTWWVVGDDCNAERNRDQWETLEGHNLDMDAVRLVDTDLADCLAD